MIFIIYIWCYLFLLPSFLDAKKIKIVSIDERAICNIKASCLECLRLPQCSWCPTESKCFSKLLPQYETYCSKDKVNHTDYGFSFEENAKCSCVGNDIESHCFASNDEEVPCSGRGKCVCGRCLCDPNPDPDNPTKIITGDFCEYDNFSCDDPTCGEGPYYIHDVGRLIGENDNDKIFNKPSEEK